ncbi:Uu.00g106800.m01.CDS01 [Anthostomella pinea]|uniref:Uu.00g106800.m01.CDS01 n=1 Tax=Anthostomella pinea TaxID=933095 RepID=A0AAI8VE81_9PEZI|nr:Uu.00g106800.m01.CDS01 [Anthostomella pinea]
MAAPSSPAPAAVTPAQLGFLAIFNPSLGSTDETIDDKVVYYASVNTQLSPKRRHRSRGSGKPTDDISQEERNERLRQIGLAQGMAEFSRGFSNGKPVDTIETEKSRVVLHELEPGWWILASIDLTKIPLPPRLGAPAASKENDRSENVEYTSRELKPAVLLLRDLLRAHSIFLLHHAASLSALFVKSKRTKFVSILGRYWDLYLSTWDVMLHDNPATSVFGGIRIAACGELGVGVGEEERGSGEREVLEGFVDRVEGLVDLIVSRFGPSEPDPDTEPAKNSRPDSETPPTWFGHGNEPGAEDGAIFLGVGALSRKSLRDVTYWMEDLYTWGENAYGVKDSPTSMRQARRPRQSAAGSKDTSGHSRGVSGRRNPANSKHAGSQTQPAGSKLPDTASVQQSDETTDEGGVNKLMGYLKMGYGSHWTLGGSAGTEGKTQDGAATTQVSQKDDALSSASPGDTSKAPGDASGHYFVGLLGDIEDKEAEASRLDESRTESDGTSHDAEYNSRVRVRTLTVELDNHHRTEEETVQDLGSQNTELTTMKSGLKDSMDPNSQFDSQDRNKTQKVRVVVYVNRPFVYTFLFENRTDSLAWDSLYKSLHHQLAPLREPLTASTAFRPGKPDIGATASHIFDLIWDPKAMTVQSTIPSIPTTAHMLQTNTPPLWSRAEAINTHNQILNTYIATLSDYSELERTCKTNRGWWVVWTRIMERASPFPIRQGKSGSQGSEDSEAATRPGLPTAMSDESIESRGPGKTNARPKPRVTKEIFLIRRAGEHTGLRAVSSSYAEGSGGWADGASRLAQGMGVDTYKYIEGLLSLSR